MTAARSAHSRFDEVLRAAIHATCHPFQFAQESYPSTDRWYHFHRPPFSSDTPGPSEEEQKCVYWHQLSVQHNHSPIGYQQAGSQYLTVKLAVGYLTEKQSIKLSSAITLNTGVPQGCVLSPLLFNPLTHDCTPRHSSNLFVNTSPCWTLNGPYCSWTGLVTEHRLHSLALFALPPK